MKLFEPSSSEWPSAAPPSNASPSILPTKSMTTMSPFLAARGFVTSTLGRFSPAIVVKASSICASSTGKTGFSIDSLLISGILISGMISHVKTASRSLPSSYDLISTDGWLARLRPLSSTALRAPSSSADLIASPCTCAPKRVFTTAIGTLPGRKPGIFAVLAISASLA